MLPCRAARGSPIAHRRNLALPWPRTPGLRVRLRVRVRVRLRVRLRLRLRLWLWLRRRLRLRLRGSAALAMAAAPEIDPYSVMVALGYEERPD